MVISTSTSFGSRFSNFCESFNQDPRFMPHIANIPQTFFCVLVSWSHHYFIFHIHSLVIIPHTLFIMTSSPILIIDNTFFWPFAKYSLVHLFILALLCYGNSLHFFQFVLSVHLQHLWPRLVLISIVPLYTSQI
jgi:hypothetical protein